MAQPTLTHKMTQAPSLTTPPLIQCIDSNDSMIAHIEGRIANLENQLDRPKQRLTKHDGRLKRHNTLIKHNTKLLKMGSRKHEDAMEALKLTHRIAMVGLLRNRGQDDQEKRIENEYAKEFTTPTSTTTTEGGHSLIWQLNTFMPTTQGQPSSNRRSVQLLLVS